MTHSTAAVVYAKMNNETVKKLWNGFCLTQGEIELTSCDEFIFRIGSTAIPPLGEGKDYTLSVDENGVAIVGKDYGGLMRGFMSLIMKIEYREKKFFIKHTQEQSQYSVQKRMIHICVFPENDLLFIKKLIRLAGLCQYTHVVIEFWGMLKYDCLKELAWPHAYTKDEAAGLIAECRQLGMEPIPMFNMFGHAAGSRVRYGKHVVLDQNPTLQYLFTPDGWAWDITSPEVYDLFKQVRQELYALFGPTQYFHIGCDEAYYYMRSDEMRRLVPEFLGRLTADIASENRQPMMWMDMVLEGKDYPSEYYAFGKEGESKVFLKALAKETVMVDWQYNVEQAPILSSVFLKDKGHELIVAPWLKAANYTACVDTVIEHDLAGVMLTTWHTLKFDMPGVVGCAMKCGAKTFAWSLGRTKEETASMLRRISFEGNTYADCGWSKEQIEM